MPVGVVLCELVVGVGADVGTVESGVGAVVYGSVVESGFSSVTGCGTVESSTGGVSSGGECVVSVEVQCGCECSTSSDACWS